MINVPVYQTVAGTPYLRDPGVVVMGRTVSGVEPLKGFLGGFDPELQFTDYLLDPPEWHVMTEEVVEGRHTWVRDADYVPQSLPESAQLVKIAGQVCYMSFSPNRTLNRDAVKYVHNLVSSGHGSPLEHPNVSILFYGVSRSITHELVRHRAGCGYSQLSQRYVFGKMVRFVERPEYVGDPNLHAAFEADIDADAAAYEQRAAALLARQKEGEALLSGETGRDRRKKVNQAARSVLGNHTEAPIVMTANIRAWRHVISMRASEHAETEIRRALYRAFLCLAVLDPILFGDYTVVDLPDGTRGVTTPYPKV